MSSTKQLTYRNKTDVQQTVIGVGVVEGKGTIKVSEPFTNPNFELVEDKPTFKSKSEQRRVEATQAAKKPEGKE